MLGIICDVVRAARLTEAAAARRWRRLAAGCLRYAAWRPWAAERSAASALALAAPRAAARENLLMATMPGAHRSRSATSSTKPTVEGRIALADALVAAAEGPGRSKRKAEELS